MKNKRIFIRSSLLSVYIYMTFSCLSAFGGKKPEEIRTISTGMELPKFMLDAPSSTEEKKYLGLSELKPFSFSQISAQIIILEIFSVYCPHCRKQAAVLNQVFKSIKEDPQLSKGIKIVGIAAGARKGETEEWKTTLNIPFPLFSDPETTIWQTLGKPGVPSTILVSNTGKVLAIHLGATEDIESFFREIKKYYDEQR